MLKLNHEDSIEVAILNSLDNEALSHEHLRGDAREMANAQGVYDNYRCYAETYGIDVQEFKAALLKTYGWLIQV
jgi:hypothetical protein